MPVVIVLDPSSGGGGAVTPIATTTVQDMIDCVRGNLKETFAVSGANTILIDYINTIHQQILRHRRWDWTLSEPQRFITEKGQSNYWIGLSGSSPNGSVDTLLDLDDIQYVANAGLHDRSQFRSLYSVKTPPLNAEWQRADGSYSEGLPAQFRTTLSNAGLLSIYPAPDMGTEYLLVPPAPHSTTATGGALSARTYYLRVTYVDAAGNESLASTTARQYVGSSKLLTVRSPVVPIGAGSSGIAYSKYRVYASTTSGSETLQNGSGTNIGTNWTEAASGLTTNGASVPATATIEPLRGHIIEFQYHRRHVNLDEPEDVLLVPDEYADVVCAGATSMAAQYKAEEKRTAYWWNVYQEGLMRMVQNDNIGPGMSRFIGSDGTWDVGIGGFWY